MNGSNMSDKNKININSIWRCELSDKTYFYIVTDIDKINNIVEHRDLETKEMFKSHLRNFLEYFQHVG